MSASTPESGRDPAAALALRLNTVLASQPLHIQMSALTLICSHRLKAISGGDNQRLVDGIELLVVEICKHAGLKGAAS